MICIKAGDGHNLTVQPDGDETFDVMHVDGRWLLTDSGPLLLWFLSSEAAIAEGKRRASARELPTVLYLWRANGADEVFRNKAATSPTE